MIWWWMWTPLLGAAAPLKHRQDLCSLCGTSLLGAGAHRLSCSTYNAAVTALLSYRSISVPVSTPDLNLNARQKIRDLARSGRGTSDRPHLDTSLPAADSL
jgi:hypothetical protein